LVEENVLADLITVVNNPLEEIAFGAARMRRLPPEGRENFYGAGMWNEEICPPCDIRY
jgi:hypothetical protein